MSLSSIYKKVITIPKSAIDENGHVNNVTYVQWMQDVAVEHYSAIGGIQAQGAEYTWVVHEHRVQYVLPAFVGEQVEIRTWVENVRKVRSLRMYEFIRVTDGRTLVKGETDWVFVEIKSGRPGIIPAAVIERFRATFA